MLIIVAFLMAAVSSLVLTAGSRLAFAAGRPEENQQRMLPAGRYEKLGSAEVKGRQGICTDGEYYWVSGSASLAKYDHDWNLIAENEDPFKGYEIEVNHIGDIDVFEGELYIGAEYFKDGEGKNIQIAVYDTDTLELKRTFPFEPKSGQLECSGIAVDPDTKTQMVLAGLHTEGTFDCDLIFPMLFLDQFVEIIDDLAASFYVACASDADFYIYHNYSP